MEKLEIYRNYTVAVVFLASLLCPIFWLWDYALDPAGAFNTIPHRTGISALLIVLGIVYYYQLAPKFNGAMFSFTMVATQAIYFANLSQLDVGFTTGIGSLLIWFILSPLISIGLSLTTMMVSLLMLVVAPLIWYLFGFLPLLQLDVFIAYMLPTAFIVAVIAYLSDKLILQILYGQQLLIEAKNSAELLARTDVLSGMNNRRAFFELSDTVFISASRYGQAVSVITLDIDKFKIVNDTYGHDVGDQVIKDIAKVIYIEMRNSDISGRIGGEEFAITLPHTTLAQATDIAERLRKAIKNRVTSTDENRVLITASLGVAEKRANENEVSRVLKRADKALYAAKERGRDCVCLSTE